VDDIP
jgi:hypothetical protein